MKEFKVGDKVIFKNFGVEERGTIIEDEIYMNPLTVRNANGGAPLSIISSKYVYRVKYDKVIDNVDSSYYHVRNLRLDVQYYREERFKKLLDDRYENR